MNHFWICSSCSTGCTTTDPTAAGQSITADHRSPRWLEIRVPGRTSGCATPSEAQLQQVKQDLAHSVLGRGEAATGRQTAGATWRHDPIRVAHELVQLTAEVCRLRFRSAAASYPRAR